MITSGELFVCLVAGLAMPLAILDAARAMFEDGLPEQGDGFQLERRLAPWMLALFAGPALLFDRVAGGWRDSQLSKADIASGAFITAGWAVLYGFVVLKFIQYLGM